VPRQESLPFTSRAQLVERLVPWQFTRQAISGPRSSRCRRKSPPKLPESLPHPALSPADAAGRGTHRPCVAAAKGRHHLAIVLGQVASQTLQNLQSVGSIARLSALSPLVGEDKLEIQEVAPPHRQQHDISRAALSRLLPRCFSAESRRLFSPLPEALDAR